MIEIVKGIVVSKEPGHVIVDVGGLGYGLDISINTYTSLPQIGHEISLFVHTYVREDILKLFGFSTEEEREVFEVFITVSGIGPKTGLAILSSIAIDEFAAAILNRDITILTKIPGIGKKTAETARARTQRYHETFFSRKRCGRRSCSRGGRSTCAGCGRRAYLSRLQTVYRPERRRESLCLSWERLLP